jgi:hypothetical protein
MHARSSPGKPRKDSSKVECVRLAYSAWGSSRGRSQVQMIHAFTAARSRRRRLLPLECVVAGAGRG